MAHVRVGQGFTGTFRPEQEEMIDMSAPFITPQSTPPPDRNEEHAPPPPADLIELDWRTAFE